MDVDIEYRLEIVDKVFKSLLHSFAVVLLFYAGKVLVVFGVYVFLVMAEEIGSYISYVVDFRSI